MSKTKGKAKPKAPKTKKQKAKAKEPFISVHSDDALGHDHRNIENMDDSSFNNALSNPVRIVNEPVSKEEEQEAAAETEVKPKKVKAVRLKTHERTAEALEEAFQFDKEEFLALYEGDFSNAKELYTRIVSLFVGYRSAIDSLKADLEHHPDLREIDIQKSQVEAILRYKSQELICESLGIDPAAYFDYTVRTLEARLRAPSRNTGVPVG